MKVTFIYGIGSFKGTTAQAVYAPTKNKNASIMRRWVKPTYTTQNEFVGNAAKNLAVIYRATNPLWKADLASYADLINKNSDPNDQFVKIQNKYSTFTKAMYAFAEDKGPTVDLATITLNDITSLFTELDSVASIVEAGYLPQVKGAELLTAPIEV